MDKKETKLIVFPISDIHLEFRLKYKNLNSLLPTLDKEKLIEYQPYQTCLVIAGDLGYPKHAIYSKFLNIAKSTFDHVIVVAGNHEYYKQKHQRVGPHTIDPVLKDICDKAGCVFLQKSIHELVVDSRVIRIAGCTYWSHIPKNLEYICLDEMSDFRNILNSDSNFWSVEDYNQTHKDHLNWIKHNALGKVDFIVTHHLPTFLLIDNKFGHSDLNCCFASNDLSDKEINSVPLWICGHSHEFNYIRIKNSRLVLNPLGYPNEDTKHQKDLFIVV